QRLLIGRGRRIVVESQLQLRALRSLWRGHHEPTIRPLADVRLLHEAQHLGVEAQGLVLLVGWLGEFIATTPSGLMKSDGAPRRSWAELFRPLGPSTGCSPRAPARARRCSYAVTFASARALTSAFGVLRHLSEPPSGSP